MKPSRLIGAEAKLSLKFFGAHALFATCHEIHRHEPERKRFSGFVKCGASGDADLMLAGGTIQDVAGSAMITLRVFALRTLKTVFASPPLLADTLKARFFCSELLLELDKVRWKFWYYRLISIPAKADEVVRIRGSMAGDLMEISLGENLIFVVFWLG